MWWCRRQLVLLMPSLRHHRQAMSRFHHLLSQWSRVASGNEIRSVQHQRFVMCRTDLPDLFQLWKQEAEELTASLMQRRRAVSTDDTKDVDAEGIEKELKAAQVRFEV